jgi:hypothetical protein
MTTCQDVVIPIIIMTLSSTFALSLLPHFIQTGKKMQQDDIFCSIVRFIILIIIAGLEIHYYKNIRPGTRNTSTANTSIIVLSVIYFICFVYQEILKKKNVNSLLFITKVMVNFTIILLPCIEAYLNHRRPLSSDNNILLPQPLTTSSSSSSSILPTTSQPVPLV